jgi:hypothetical protein
MKDKLIHQECKNKDCDRPAINGKYCDRCKKKKNELFQKIGGGFFTIVVGATLVYSKIKPFIKK